MCGRQNQQMPTTDQILAACSQKDATKLYDCISLLQMRKPRHKKGILLQLKGWEKLELRLESGILASEPPRTVSRQGRGQPRSAETHCAHLQWKPLHSEVTCTPDLEQPMSSRPWQDPREGSVLGEKCPEILFGVFLPAAASCGA